MADRVLRRPPQAAAAASLLLLLLAHPARAAAPRIHDCDKSDPGRPRAQAALTALEQRMASLATPAELPAAAAALRDLLGERCFALAAFEAPRDGWWEPDALPAKGAKAPGDIAPWEVEAARQWWDEGGRDWLRGHLEPDRRAALFPPSVTPRVVRADPKPDESDPRLPAPLRCASDDKDCGAGLEGWLLRARQAFPDRRDPDGDASSDDKAIAGCLKEALREKPAARYREWWQCVEAATRTVTRLPVGGFGKPDHGWLVVRGRRGHYSFCDGVWAYDLGTGAGYQVESCSGLVLAQGGHVDSRQTDDGRKLTVRRGRLPADNLREALWMMALAPLAAQGRDQLRSVPIPAALSPAVPDDGVVSGISGSETWSSAQTVLSWTWADGDDVLAQGRLLWPNAYRAAEDHAVSLLAVTERGLVEGCAPAALPDKPWTRRAGFAVSGIDAPGGTDDTALQLADALARLRREGACPAPSSGGPAGRPPAQ